MRKAISRLGVCQQMLCLASPLALSTVYLDTGELSSLKTSPALTWMCLASNPVSVGGCWAQITSLSQCMITTHIPFKVKIPLTSRFFIPPHLSTVLHTWGS